MYAVFDEYYNCISIQNKIDTNNLSLEIGKDIDFEVIIKDGGNYTDIKKDDNLITDNELTPIVLKDNQLIGWGWAFLSQLVPNYQYKIEVH